MKLITCLNNWIVSGCCGGNRSEFVHGVKITNGRSVLRVWQVPFSVYIEKGKLVFKDATEEKVYYINEFSQSEQTIRDLIKNCVTAQLGNRLGMRTVEYDVTVDEDTFDMPVLSGEIFAGAEFVSVHMPQLINQGTGVSDAAPEFAFEYQVITNTVVFNELIPAPEPGQDPYHITITYFVYT